MPIVVPDYKAPSWCPGGHLQTVIPAKFMPRPAIEYRREKVELPDGDFMLWDWAVPEPADPSAPDRTVTLTACIRERASTAR